MLAAQGKLCQAAPDHSGSLGVCSGGGRGEGWSGWVGVTPSWGVSCCPWAAQCEAPVAPLLAEWEWGV